MKTLRLVIGIIFIISFANLSKAEVKKDCSMIKNDTISGNSWLPTPSLVLHEKIRQISNFIRHACKFGHYLIFPFVINLANRDTQNRRPI